MGKAGARQGLHIVGQYYAANPEAFHQAARNLLNPQSEHDKKAKRAKFVFRAGVVTTVMAIGQLPVLAEVLTGIGSILAPGTELGELGGGLLLAKMLGPYFDKWYDENHPAPPPQQQFQQSPNSQTPSAPPPPFPNTTHVPPPGPTTPIQPSSVWTPPRARP